ncbi:uncharacterized protein F21D5.5 [Euwallacea fornicatus]|uniref:uncharacterized protein F21D5.5 n=1 Tax=Euwallacea fornicatus TaxID=995702 RepID=UPI00339054A2
MYKTPKCVLTNLSTKKTLEIPHLTSVILGRNRQTEVKDLNVSREQLLCTSNVEEYKVILKSVGKARSGCNGLALTENRIYTIGHKDVIELRLGDHRFEVNFEPAPTISSTTKEASLSSDGPQPKKPKADYAVFNISQNQTSNTTGIWEEIGNKELLIFTPNDCKAKDKIASFDIDGTIIKTKSGARFPKDSDDWVLNYGNIKTQLSKLNDQGYKLVFFTNQSAVGIDHTRIKEFKRKIENILNSLSLPIQVFVALSKRNYRKPRVGMWDMFVQRKNEGIEIDFEKSFFVGDAAGREKNWAPKRGKDHSIADRLFALNIGIKFYTPEEYFLQQKPAQYKMPEFDPRLDISHLTYPDLTYDKLNVILMVGGQGSGKTFFVKEMLVPKGYIHVSRDLLGSWKKCIQVMEENLKRRKNVVIDNTNGDKESRQRYIQAAKKFNADVRCFIMNTSLAHMRHNNKFRELTDNTHTIVSDIIIFSYRKNYQEPEKEEGYSQILKIPFITKFINKDLEKVYKTFLLD